MPSVEHELVGSTDRVLDEDGSVALLSLSTVDAISLASPNPVSTSVGAQQTAVSLASPNPVGSMLGTAVHNLDDTLEIDDALVNGKLIVDTLTVSETAEPKVYYVYSDSIEIQDDTGNTFGLESALSDNPTIDDAVVIVATSRATITELIDATEIVDSLEGYRTVTQDFSDLIDAAEISTSIDNALNDATLSDDPSIDDAAVVQITARVVAADDPTIDDSVVTSQFTDAADTMTIDDTSVETYTLFALAEDTATIDDTFVDQLAASAVIAETLAIDDTFDSRLGVALEDYTDVLFIDDALLSSSGFDTTTGWAADDAWTANVATWAMSRFSSPGVSEQTSQFAGARAGLYDFGTNVGARIETGFTDFGVKYKKRVPYLYIQGSHDDPLTVTVTGELANDRQSYSYTPQSATDTSDPLLVRTRLGKGFSSVYYQFVLESTSNASFFGCEAQVDTTQRRI